jgi:hypothetical protein
MRSTEYRTMKRARLDDGTQLGRDLHDGEPNGLRHDHGRFDRDERADLFAGTARRFYRMAGSSTSPRRETP